MQLSPLKHISSVHDCENVESLWWQGRLVRMTTFGISLVWALYNNNNLVCKCRHTLTSNKLLFELADSLSWSTKLSAWLNIAITVHSIPHNHRHIQTDLHCAIKTSAYFEQTKYECVHVHWTSLLYMWIVPNLVSDSVSSIFGLLPFPSAFTLCYTFYLFLFSGVASIGARGAECHPWQCKIW